MNEQVPESTGMGFVSQVKEEAQFISEVMRSFESRSGRRVQVEGFSGMLARTCASASWDSQRL